MSYVSDFIMNGRGHGEFAAGLEQVSFKPGMLRPYFTENKAGKTVAVVNVDGEIIPCSELERRGTPSPVANATSLRKDDWILFDQAVIKAARQRLRAWGDLQSANSFGGFDGMSRTILEHETMSDPGEAIVDMDGLSEGRGDSPKYQLEGLPLPITHSSFTFSSRRLAVSRNSGTPLDTTMAEAAGRRVAEQIEKTTIGTVAGLTYGDSTAYSRTSQVYGYTTFPGRITGTAGTAPTGGNGPTILTEFLGWRDQLFDNNFYGPFMVYTSTGWDQYLDNLFSTSEPSAGTLRSRLLQVDGVQDIRRLDYLTSGFQVIFVQMTSDVARAVVGMPMTTVQWDTKGGMQKNFKVMSIMVPQLREDFAGNCGILHATST